MIPNPNPEEHAVDIAALQAAAAVAPRSLKVQANLGETLYNDGKLAEAFGPISAAADLWANRGKGRSTELELLRAITAHAAKDPCADTLYQRASDLFAHNSKPSNDLSELREQARRTFGR